MASSAIEKRYLRAWLRRAKEISDAMGIKGVTFKIATSKWLKKHPDFKFAMGWARGSKTLTINPIQFTTYYTEAELTDVIIHELTHITMSREADMLWFKGKRKNARKIKRLDIESNNHGALFTRKYEKNLKIAVRKVKGFRKIFLGRAGGELFMELMPAHRRTATLEALGKAAFKVFKKTPKTFKFAALMGPKTEFLLYEPKIQKATREMIRAIKAQSKKDFATLSLRERRLRQQLTRILSDLPFVRGGAGKFVLDLSKNRKINSAVSRAFSFLDAYDDASEAAFNIQGFSPHQLSKVIALQMRQINRIAMNSWQTVLGALKDPSQFGANVVKESRQIINTQRLLQRKLNVILKNQLQKSTYGKASNVVALLSEA